MAYRLWECLVCGFVYDEALGWPDDGIAPGTRWEDVPEDWLCPDCGVGKADFEMREISRNAGPAVEEPELEAAVATPSAAPASAVEPESAIDFSRPAVVIIGTGLAGYNTARAIRSRDASVPLVMITADDGAFYSKPAVSTGLAKGKQPHELVSSTAADMAQKLAADIRIFTRVEGIDRANHEVVTNAGVIRYGKLVIASGARCIEPPLEGDGLQQVYQINNLHDYTRFRTALVGKQKVAIIGGGLIGCEYANDLASAGYQVEVIEAMPTLLSALIPAEVAAPIQQALETAGVRYHFDTVANRVDQNGPGVTVTLANGNSFDADLVLSAIGVRPDLTLAQQAGLDTNRGIVTNRQLQSSDPDIYAVGDCAEVDGHLLFYVAPLLHCANVVADQIAGTDNAAHYGVMPVVVKTTLCPLTVVPPPRGIQGRWHIDQTDGHTNAQFRDASGVLLGFALTGAADVYRDQLAAETKPLMA